MLTPGDLISAGYKKYSQQNYKDADYLLQKRIDDDKGKKYFIDIWVYDWKKFKDRNPHLPDNSFQPEVQFQFRDDSRATVNVSLLIDGTYTIEKIEKEFEEMWVFLGMPYYSKYD